MLQEPVGELAILAGENASARMVHFGSECELLAVEGQGISILVQSVSAPPALVSHSVDQVTLLTDQLQCLDRLAVIFVSFGRISVNFLFD